MSTGTIPVFMMEFHAMKPPPSMNQDSMHKTGQLQALSLQKRKKFVFSSSKLSLSGES
jgi:hypothetical protein